MGKMIRDTVTALLSPHLSPLELTLVLLLGPLVAGLLAGTALRRLWRRPKRPLAWTIALLVAMPTGAVYAGLRYRLGIWDAATIGLLAALGTAAGLFEWRRRRGELLLAGAATAVTLLAVEWGVRVLAPPPPAHPPIESARLFLPTIDRDRPRPAGGDFAVRHRELVDGCALLFPDRHPAHVAERVGESQRAGGGSVLYVGDSMTYGLGVAMQHSFPASVERLAGSGHHINLGFPGTGTDYHYVIARRWLEHVPAPVHLVVLGLYYNDILEIGQSQPCCDGRSLLAVEAGKPPVERCQTPRWVAGYGESFGWFVRNSPSPYPLRAAMEVSHLARYVEALRVRRCERIASPDMPHQGGEWEQLRAILAALRDELRRRNIDLLVVLMPPRFALEAAEPAATDGYRLSREMAASARALGIDTLDPWDHFRTLVQAGEPVFLGDRDIHLSQRGHEELARWLLAHYPPLRGAASTNGRVGARRNSDRSDRDCEHSQPQRATA